MTERVINIAIFHGRVLLVAEGKLVRFKYPTNNNHSYLLYSWLFLTLAIGIYILKCLGSVI
jgi:hypothetical protein